MASISRSQRSLGLLSRPILSPNTHTLRPRIHQAGLAQVQHSEPSTDPEAELELLKEPLPSSSRLLKVDPELRKVLVEARLPKSVQAIHLKPLRRKPTHGIPVCDLQLRSFNVRSLELFADFAMRAAYFLNLPARGPVYLPRIVEKWTVPRSNFVHKKSQENFNRITVRRLIQIQDGHAEAVQHWLDYLYKRSFAGVGMKANLYDWEELGVPKRMDEGAEQAMKDFTESWGNFSIRDNEKTAEKIEEYFSAEKFEHVPRRDEHYVRFPKEIARQKPRRSTDGGSTSD